MSDRHLDTPTFLESDSPGWSRFWSVLIAVAAGHAAQCGVPVERITGSAMLREQPRASRASG